jgi:hypothetical protein
LLSDGETEIKINGTDTVKSNIINRGTYFQMVLWYLHFAAHGSLLAGIFAVWVRLPFPVEHLVVFAFSENNRMFLLPCGNMN